MSKLVYTIVEDRDGVSLLLNGDLCKYQTFDGMRLEGVTTEHVIGRWVMGEVKNFGGVVKF